MSMSAETTDITDSQLHDRLAEVRAALADDWTGGLDYDALSVEEDHLTEEIDRRKKANAKQAAKAEPSPEPSTISAQIAALRTQLAEAETQLDGMKRTPTSALAPPPLTLARDGEGNPLPVAEASVMASHERADAFVRVEAIKQSIADLERRLPFEAIAQDELVFLVEDLQIERENHRLEAQRAQQENRPAAQRRAERLASDVADKLMPALVERDTRVRETNLQSGLERAAIQRAKSMRHRRLAEWRSREAELNERFGGVKAKDYPNFDWKELVEAQNQVELLEKLIASDAPPAPAEIAAVADSVRSSVTVVAPSIADGVW
jgi:hypothetical protein